MNTTMYQISNSRGPFLQTSDSSSSKPHLGKLPSHHQTHTLLSLRTKHSSSSEPLAFHPPSKPHTPFPSSNLRTSFPYPKPHILHPPNHTLPPPNYTLLFPQPPQSSYITNYSSSKLSTFYPQTTSTPTLRQNPTFFLKQQAQLRRISPKYSYHERGDGVRGGCRKRRKAIMSMSEKQRLGLRGGSWIE
jgi:hypothetical protein